MLRFAVVLLLASCSRGSGTGDPGGDAGAATHGALVARVGSTELYEDDVQRAIARDPGASPARFANAAARRELIDGLVRFELLAQAAERAGLTRDPDAVHALRQIAVTKLVNRTIGAAASPEAITTADIQREYVARQATEFTLPEAAQVRHIRVNDAKLAVHLAALARALAPADDAGFAALASRHTEDASTRATGGALGFIDETSRLPPTVVDAARRLRTPGEVAGPLQTDSGYEILRLVTIRAAAVSPRSSVEEPIRQRLYRERRAHALDDYIAKLRATTPTRIVEPHPPLL